MTHRHFPRYNDDADFTTNAPSYYEDLARKEKLIRLLAERIWGYEKILDDTLEEIQERFRAWDKNLEDFPEDVKVLLQQWLDNGTLDHIINDTIFNWKLDTAIFEQFRDSITAQLAHTANSVGFNVSWYALEVENDDWTPVIQKTLDLHGHAVISGKLPVMSTVMIKTKQYLEIMNDAELYKPATASNNEPVVWINSSHATLRGHNKHSSFIRSELPTPYGVVTLGYKGMNDTGGKNVLYCTIQNIGIRGHKEGGNETGDWSVALGLMNPQVNNLASYFHSINHIFLADANIGMLFEGNANANIVDDIQFINTGNEKWLGGGAIVIKNTDNMQPLDNVITNIFHHKSFNADTLVFDGGGFYNTFTNIVSEQGGLEARWVYERNQQIGTAHNNIITGIQNVSQQSNVSEGFWTRNTNINTNSMGAEYINGVYMGAEKFTASQITYGNEFGSKMGCVVLNSPLEENKAYEALRVAMGDYIYNMTFMVELNLTFYSPIAYLRGSQKAVFEVDFGRQENETTVTLLSSVGSREFIINPIINGFEVLFGFKVNDNGTGTTNQSAYLDYKVTGNDTSVITPATENVIIGVPVTLIKNVSFQ